MTTHKTLKRRVRARMDKTGERYTAARRNVIAEPASVASAAPKAPSASAPPLVSDEAVRRATNRGWDEWFAILDAAGAVEWDHRQIARYINSAHGVPGWWAQNVTVGYERARGKRAAHERPSGFSLSVTRTVNVPVERLFEAFAEETERAAWLDHEMRVRRATAPRNIRFDWGDGSRVVAGFMAKGDVKAQIALEHAPLADGAAVEELRVWWRSRLDGLKRRLEAEVS